jgi:hypothetical protein
MLIGIFILGKKDDTPNLVKEYQLSSNLNVVSMEKFNNLVIWTQDQTPLVKSQQDRKGVKCK